MLPPSLIYFVWFFGAVEAILNATESATQYILQNDDLYVAVNKSNGQVGKILLQGENLLGATGKGPYVDCSCVPSGFWGPGNPDTSSYRLITGSDASHTPYGGIVLNDNYGNQSIEQYWFLREGETGIHTFTRVYYYNGTGLQTLGELRTLFRPNTDLWTHLYANQDNWAPRPTSEGVPAQDATGYVGNLTDMAYVQQYANFFTKYAFADQWRNHKVHGMYADGSTSKGNVTYGAWLVHNTVETYYGGPLHSDIMVDGIVYNYIVSSHHGARTPNMTDGFDRTFGPQYHHFNKNGSLQELAADAAQYADPAWNADFYDELANHVPNYVVSSRRTTFEATISVPKTAREPIAVLAENHQDFQSNTIHGDSLQYWAEISSSGEIEIPRVKEGTYRLTIYADGVFGWFIQDDIRVSTSNKTVPHFTWSEEEAGTEIWRIGTPDKSAGEFKHGKQPYKEKELQPDQFRMYWALWDFPSDFPDGVNYKVGESVPEEDFNYIHWSVISQPGNFFRSEPYYDNVNNWTIRFDLAAESLARVETATFTVQVAGAKTGSRNPEWVNLPYTLNVNGADVETYIIPWNVSTSCGVRSAVSCHNFAHKFVFPTSILVQGENFFVLSLPFNASSVETAMLPWTTYIQYDALRLELE
ncbi:rhamnogalacturonate lyase C [Pestalotiopsis fici W106-1]|uniref:rhamnogalacturonan endolyase n=1 Tax=Pestalotiopsis fici (strain W106-1 / CGMCC3.15140) TaxID=1229662 RepID=W3XFT0_PESFW|nr:rhamnogalacturonate lyase C [Pestalotiopsis fici W106-1]ETS84958.1 rhamnogalacturonate lyase C [Pestalotiopsis fici W106-1]